VRDTAPTPRRRRPAAKVAPPPISEAELPLWLIEPKKCIAPVDLDDLDKGLCGKPVNRVGNQTLTCSTDCGKKLETVGWRRRGQKYYWTHREEILTLDFGPPRPCRAPVDLDDPDKGLCGKLCPNRRRPTCGDDCRKKLRLQSTRRAGKNFRQNHKEELRAAEKEDRKANPEWYKNNWARFYARHRERLNAELREKRAAKRAATKQAAIAAGTFVDRRRKLTDAQRSEIIERRKAGETLAAIAKSYGVSITAIRGVTTYKRG
jgi:hypothetical protein